MNLFRPVDSWFGISQPFGVNVTDYPKRQGHPGVDFGTPVRSNAYACADGVIRFMGYRPESGYGREVQLLIDGRYVAYYGHLAEYRIKTGDRVKRGQVIGLTGGDPADSDPIDGMSSGPHLHFEIRDLQKPQVYPLLGAFDPEPFFSDETTRLDVKTGTVIDGGLAVRTEPTAAQGDKTVVRRLAKGAKVDYDLVESIWLRLTDGNFVAARYAGKDLVRME